MGVNNLILIHFHSVAKLLSLDERLTLNEAIAINIVIATNEAPIQLSARIEELSTTIPPIPAPRAKQKHRLFELFLFY